MGAAEQFVPLLAVEVEGEVRQAAGEPGVWANVEVRSCSQSYVVRPRRGPAEVEEAELAAACPVVPFAAALPHEAGHGAFACILAFGRLLGLLVQHGRPASPEEDP